MDNKREEIIDVKNSTPEFLAERKKLVFDEAMDIMNKSSQFLIIGTKPDGSGFRMTCSCDPNYIPFMVLHMLEVILSLKDTHAKSQQIDKKNVDST